MLIDEKNSDNTETNMDHIFKNRIVFIDTCSCLHDKFEVFMKKAVPYLEHNSCKLYIAYKCVEELINKSTDEELSAKAKYALSLIKELSERGIIEIRGKASDSFADSSIIQNFLRYKEKYNLMLITQDYGLATDVVALNHTLSVSSRGHSIKVRKINANGNLTNLRKL